MIQQSKIFPFMKVLNYSIRGLVVLIGIGFVSGILIPETAGVNDQMFRIMGIVFILFGIYRLVTYYSQQKRYEYEKDDDE